MCSSDLEGQVQPRGRERSIEGVAQAYSFFSAIKNLDINKFLCAIKIKEEDLELFEQKKGNKNNVS